MQHVRLCTDLVLGVALIKERKVLSAIHNPVAILGNPSNRKCTPIVIEQERGSITFIYRTTLTKKTTTLTAQIDLILQCLLSSGYHGLPFFLFYYHRDALSVSRIAEDCEGLLGLRSIVHCVEGYCSWKKQMRRKSHQRLGLILYNALPFDEFHSYSNSTDCSELIDSCFRWQKTWNSPIYYYLRPPSVPFRLFHRPNSHGHS